MSPLTTDAFNAIPAPIRTILEAYLPTSVLRCLLANSITFRLLNEHERYEDASPTLERMGGVVSSWPIPPAGLFVVAERSVIIRQVSPMTVCHEAGHALDCAVGAGVYLSGIDPRIRRAFAQATAFVTPYAASACDEYFAEGARALWNANDAHSLWPKATSQRLEALDPTLFELLTTVLHDVERRYGSTALAVA